MRILLKISGEQLGSEQDGKGQGFDVGRAKWLAGEIRQTLANALNSGPTEIAIMVGGGNFVRGAFFDDAIAKNEIGQTTADNTGMLATIINATLLGDIFRAEGVPTAVLSNVSVQQVADDFTFRRAESHFKKGRVVILAGGTGRPLVTTDTGAVNLALELKCDFVAKATKVDGVYTADPKTDPAAQKIAKISYEQAINDPKIRVMDKAALGMAGDHQMPIVVFDLLKDGNIAKVAAGEIIGTKIS
ncbi:MAG: uridine monophosphate kinase [Candidatus Nomurabacteria bacterium]|jgi:uridylate kinase|nr:uridine monophosphate kinase [Candidatus Nomurabacteria bacterium]